MFNDIKKLVNEVQGNKDKPNYVAVYGTLKKGYRYHHLMGDSKFIGTYYTVDKFDMYYIDAYHSYPYITDGDSSIKVEVYKVSDETLRDLDILEDAPELYERRTVLLEGFDSPVYLYVINKDNDAPTQYPVPNSIF